MSEVEHVLQQFSSPGSLLSSPPLSTTEGGDRIRIAMVADGISMVVVVSAMWVTRGGWLSGMSSCMFLLSWSWFNDFTNLFLSRFWHLVSLQRTCNNPFYQITITNNNLIPLRILTTNLHPCQHSTQLSIIHLPAHDINSICCSHHESPHRHRDSLPPHIPPPHCLLSDCQDQP